MPVIQIPPSPVVIPNGPIRLTEFARHLRVPWIYLGDGNVLHAERGLMPLTVAAGAPKKHNIGRKALGYGGTAGGGSTDRHSGLRLRTATSGFRSIISVQFALGYGGGGLGRIFQQNGGTGTSAEAWYLGANLGSIKVIYNHSAGGVGVQWVMNAGAPSTSSWEQYGMTHDQRTDANVVPQWYLQGDSAANTTQQASGNAFDSMDIAVDIGNRSTDSLRVFDGYIGFIVPIDGQLTAKDHRDAFPNPAALFIEEEPIWIPVGSMGSSPIVLVGANGAQAQAGSAGALVQQHQLAGAPGAQAAAGGSGALVQTHSLSGTNGIQAQAASSAALTQTHVLTGAAATQGNTAAVANLQQTHILAGAPGAQANPGTAGAIAQTHILTGAPATQVNSGTSGAIYQQHNLQGADGLQNNAGSTGSLNGGTVVLSGSPGAQANSGSAGALVQQHILAGSAGTTATSAGTGAIGQQHVLAGAPGVQANVGSTGSLGEVLIILGGAPGAQANVGSSGGTRQTFLLAGAAALQANQGAAAAITQLHALLGAAGVQVNVASSGSLVEAVPSAVALPELRRSWSIEAAKRSWTITTER